MKIYKLPTHLEADYQRTMLAAIEDALREALRSPCSKSKRGAAIYSAPGTHDGICVARHNKPPYPFTCLRTPACRAACGQICNHAEERCVADFLREQNAAHFGGTYDMLHVEVVDGEPVVFDRPGKPTRPSCITCARAMLDAKVRQVWLYSRRGWRCWTAVEFMRATILELELLPADAMEGIR